MLILLYRLQSTGFMMGDVYLNVYLKYRNQVSLWPCVIIPRLSNLEHLTKKPSHPNCFSGLKDSNKMQKPSIKENKKSIQNINIRINPIVNFKKVGGLLI